jgi:peptide/nickel transport system permease protein
MSSLSADPTAVAGASFRHRFFQTKNTVFICALTILVAYVAVAVFSPLLAGDFVNINPTSRLIPPGSGHWFGTDQMGRDIFARTLVGTRNSLVVGGSVAILTTVIGTTIGLLAGYFQIGEWLIMRIMDGLMAIPGVLLAIAFASLIGGGIGTVIIAIIIPEIPRMVRLVRSIVLSLKEQTYVVAAVSLGTRTWKILVRHILPNAVGSLTVQATYVAASAIITEAILSFLGIGSTADSPSWGMIMSQGRLYFQIAPWILFFPGLCLSFMVLTVNILGDSLRDTLDPRLKNLTDK